MSFNTTTITLAIKDTRISIRDGLQYAPEMLMETLHHYGECIKALENGIFELGEEWLERDDYTVIAPHDEAIITVYRMTPVMVKSGQNTVPINLNVFTECTSAQDMLNHVSMALNALGALVDQVESKTAKNGTTARNLGSSANTQERRIPAPDLDQHFPPETQVTHPDNPRNKPPQSASGETPLLDIPANKEAKVQFGIDWNKQTVAFPVSAVEMKFSPKTGKPEYQFYGYFNDRVSQYPAYGLSVDTGDKHAKEQVVNLLTSLDMRPQERREINGRVVVWVKAGVTKQGEPTTYYNINKLDIEGVEPDIDYDKLKEVQF